MRVGLFQFRTPIRRKLGELEKHKRFFFSNDSHHFLGFPSILFPRCIFMTRPPHIAVIVDLPCTPQYNNEIFTINCNLCLCRGCIRLGGHVVLVQYYFRSLGYEAGLLVKSSADTPPLGSRGLACFTALLPLDKSTIPTKQAKKKYIPSSQ